MAFFFGFTPSQVDEMDVGTAFGLLESLKNNSKMAGGKVMGKLMGMG